MTDTNFTKQIYDKFAEKYHKKRQNPDENFYNLYIEMPAMLSILKNRVKNMKVLDLGCGSGIFSKKLLQLGSNVVGLDLSKSLIDIARKENPKIEFHIGDAKKTQFKKTSFDIVSSSLMIHYFNNLDPLFKEISRILKNNGTLVFSFHHPTSEVTDKVKMNGKNVSILNPYFHSNKYKWTMMKEMELISYHHTFETISKSLKKSGFLIEQIIEPKAILSGKKVNKQIYERCNNYPSFCIIVALKK